MAGLEIARRSCAEATTDSESRRRLIAADDYRNTTNGYTGLRADVSAEPVGELRRNFDWFKPLIGYYEKRTLDPESVPPKKAYLEKLGLKVNPYR